MDPVIKHIEVPLPKDTAFYNFVYKFNEWWPKEYTWSQDQLQEITIATEENGLCTETGPYNFRCDWGRVTKFVEKEEIALKWQISPQRVPEPNPANASDIRVRFETNNGSKTIVTFEHANFENHGDGAAAYQQAMDSAQGWDFILYKYLEYCKTGQ